MATVSESAASKTQLASGLAQGVETLSLSQEINFTLYVKLVLPLDGYVFWVNASLLTDNAIYNISQYNKQITTAIRAVLTVTIITSKDKKKHIINRDFNQFNITKLSIK